MSNKSWKGGFKRAFQEVSGAGDSNKHETSVADISTSSTATSSKGNSSEVSINSGSDKGSSTHSTDVSKGDKFRKHLGDYFLSNKLSALQTYDFASAATEAGAIGSEDLVKCGTTGRHPQNMHRDMLRTLLKKSQWPSEYWADVRVLDPDTQQESTVSFPFLLPHEVLHYLCGMDAVTLESFRADPETPLSKVVSESCSKTGLDPATVLPMGLHGDGAPFAAKMKDSLEQFSWNLCSQPTSTRIIFTAIPKRFVGENTMNDILQIFTWSMKCLASGKMPSSRHDSTDFVASDRASTSKQKSRVQLAGASIGVTACLVQVRGDWAFFKSVFNMPSWSSEHICWLCKATKNPGSPFDFRGKAWRNARYNENEFAALLLAAGLLSIIFQCPGFVLKYILIDWLHAVDLGVSQTVIGNLFNEVCELLPGSTRKDRVNALWLKLKGWYQQSQPPSKLDGLTPEMIKQPGKKPKLRSKAGECRYLIPFAASLAREFDDGSVHRNAVNMLLQNLLEVSLCISADPYDAKKAADACTRLCRLHVALEQISKAKGDDLGWSCKPKLHMMEELICFVGPEFGSPRNFWTYQDESWGGWLANAATRRGGPKFAATCALNLLRRYRAVISNAI